jgi:hypothetical protein
VSCVARPVQGLFITTFELTALSFILGFFAISFAWRKKPLDVSHSITIYMDTTVEQIHAEGPPAAREDWFRTPLDFISRKEWFISLLWTYFTDLGFKLKVPFIKFVSRRITTRPHNRIPTDNFPCTDATAEILYVPFIVSYAIIFALGWNFDSPY